MMNDLICIRIKDGLYIGDKKAATNLQFLIANKFTHIINCTAQLKNCYQKYKQFRYFKLKYDKNNNQQRLWGQSMKKLFKVIQFVSAAQEKGQACLMHSNYANNRSFAIIIAYLMNKYSWTLNKSLQFINSKKVQYKISRNYLNQLQQLQQELKSYRILTSQWNQIGYDNQQELILVNTFLNTYNIHNQIVVKQLKNKKSVQWKDTINKKQNNKLNQISRNIIIKRIDQQSKIKKDRQQLGMGKLNKTKVKKSTKSLHKISKQKQKISKTELDQNIYQISKHFQSLQFKNTSFQQQSPKKYNIVINNFINPRINIKQNPNLQNSPLQIRDISYSIKKQKSGKMIRRGQNVFESKSKINISDNFQRSFAHNNSKQSTKNEMFSSLNASRQKSTQQIATLNSFNSVKAIVSSLKKDKNIELIKL